MIFDKFFKRNKKKYKSTLKIADVGYLEEIIKKNRFSLKQVTNWLSEEDLATSYFDYGVPIHIRHLMNEDIGEELTYTDLIAYYSKFFDEIQYLEIGVSVGKNFLQLSDNIQKGEFTGFDIENINSALKSKYEFIENKTWESQVQSLRKEPSTFTKYLYQNKKINYLAADIWDENSWKILEGQKFNIIFSDALHDPKALLWEYEMINKYDLLADKFLIIWDDLNHGLEKSFFEIVSDMQKKKKIPKRNIFLGKVNGWLGKNEIKHDVGFISNIFLT